MVRLTVRKQLQKIKMAQFLGYEAYIGSSFLPLFLPVPTPHPEGGLVKTGRIERRSSKTEGRNRRRRKVDLIGKRMERGGTGGKS